mgnify:CR=1 FL=1
MSIVAATEVTIPETVTSVALEVWRDYGQDRGIIWDRTGREEQDGEWGDEMILWAGDRDDVRRIIEQAGFEVGDFESFDLGDGPEDFATAVREQAGC